MGYMKEKVAYLRGLADGMNIGEDAQGKLLLAMIETMDEMAATIDENEEAIIDLDECIDDICDELSDIDECIDALIEDDCDSCEGCDGCEGCGEYSDFEDDFVEVECPYCGEIVYFDQGMLESDEDLICPNCNESIIETTEDDEE